jgi:O-antigen/teichoic acid export membrane protein
MKSPWRVNTLMMRAMILTSKPCSSRWWARAPPGRPVRPRLDFGVLNGLERDIPHYKGRNNPEQTSETWNFGFSAFFTLSLGSAILLSVVSYFVFGKPLLALLLGIYLFFDKVYRAYEANSRIHYQYKENAVGQLLIGIFSLIILIYLPRYGSTVVFVGFILSSLIGILYLRRRSRLQFSWTFPLKKLWKFLLSSIPLALVTYSMDLFHVVALTILAFKCDKVTLGYYAFAYRIFQILLAIFPYLIQEVMRVRMYSHIAKTGEWSDHLPKLFYPIVVYSFVTSLICLMVYWWSGWAIGHFAPSYLYSVRAIEMLSFVLLPIGIVKICSDYLCSRVINKTFYAVCRLGLGDSRAGHSTFDF